MPVRCQSLAGNLVTFLLFPYYLLLFLFAYHGVKVMVGISLFSLKIGVPFYEIFVVLPGRVSKSYLVFG